MSFDFLSVTELAGDEVSQEQVFRVANRYYWAEPYCRDKDVIEVACGTGPGLGYLASVARSLRAGDISEPILDIARRHYGDRIQLERVDGQAMPYEDQSADAILIYEAIYYLPDAEKFMAECKRVLRPGGYVLVSTANKDLYDFNPSPHSHRYFGAKDMVDWFGGHGFTVELFGSTPLTKVSWRQRILRPIKKTVVALNLMPKSMAGKKLLKRLVFGNLVPMPAEINADSAPREMPTPLSADRPDVTHKVLYCAARLA